MRTRIKFRWTIVFITGSGQARNNIFKTVYTKEKEKDKKNTLYTDDKEEIVILKGVLKKTKLSSKVASLIRSTYL